MSEKKDINKEAYKQAEKELIEGRVKEVKDYILTTLTNIEKKKKEKEKIEEELRILKLDIEDLRNGNFAKIEERREKSKLAKAISVPINIDSDLLRFGNSNANLIAYSGSQDIVNYWNHATAGTYSVSMTNTGGLDLNGVITANKVYYL